MKIPEKVKDEIVRELDKMRKKAVDSMNACPEGQSSWIYDKGRVTGLSAAICVVNSWNDPEHGRVVARPAQGEDVKSGYRYFNGKWFFWDETGAYHYGLYESREEVESQLLEHVFSLNRDKDATD